jgi:hypothetical protein
MISGAFGRAESWRPQNRIPIESIRGHPRVLCWAAANMKNEHGDNRPGLGEA